MSLFNTIYDALNPYLISIAKLAFWISAFSIGLKIIRGKNGANINGGVYSGMVNCFIGYLFCRGTNVILILLDVIVNDILSKM